MGVMTKNRSKRHRAKKTKKGKVSGGGRVPPRPRLSQAAVTLSQAASHAPAVILTELLKTTGNEMLSL